MSPPKKSSPYHHGDLRSELLSAAVDIIRERGGQGLSLRECARRAGVSHAAPYRHFASKDALLVALACQGFRWLADAGKAAMETLSDPRAQLDAYGVAYVQFALKHPEHHRLMFASELDKSAASEEDLAASGAAFELLHATAAKVDGTSEEESLGAAFAFWSLVHGLSMLILDGRVPPELIETPEQVEALTRASFAHWRRN